MTGQKIGGTTPQRNEPRDEAREAPRPDEVDVEEELAIYGRLLDGWRGHSVSLSPHDAIVAARLLEELAGLRIDRLWLTAYVEGAEVSAAARDELHLRASPPVAEVTRPALRLHRAPFARQGRRVVGGVAAAIERARQGAATGR